MSGHSKWAQIKRKKAVIDQKRGALFSRFAKEIVVAARTGGDKPDANIRLRAAVDRARAASMPKENIERAIKRGAGLLPGVVYEEVTYEGYGPGGIAVIVECFTDNRNRTLSEIRKILSDFEAKMVQPGSIRWLFDQPPVSIENAELQNRIDKLFEALDDQDEVEDIVSNLSE